MAKLWTLNESKTCPSAWIEGLPVPLRCTPSKVNGPIQDSLQASVPRAVCGKMPGGEHNIESTIVRRRIMWRSLATGATLSIRGAVTTIQKHLGEP
jgi:hypothetical protein